MNVLGRRQRQAKNGYAHLAAKQRPNYAHTDAATSARRLQTQIANERERDRRRGMSNKKKG